MKARKIDTEYQFPPDCSGQMMSKTVRDSRSGELISASYWKQMCSHAHSSQIGNPSTVDFDFSVKKTIVSCLGVCTHDYFVCMH